MNLLSFITVCIFFYSVSPIKNYSCFLAAFIVLSSCGLLFNRSCFFTAPTVLYSWDILFNRFFSDEYICDRFLCISCLFFHIPSFVLPYFFSLEAHTYVSLCIILLFMSVILHQLFLFFFVPNFTCTL